MPNSDRVVIASQSDVGTRSSGLVPSTMNDDRRVVIKTISRSSGLRPFRSTSSCSAAESILQPPRLRHSPIFLAVHIILTVPTVVNPLLDVLEPLRTRATSVSVGRDICDRVRFVIYFKQS